MLYTPNTYKSILMIAILYARLVDISIYGCLERIAQHGSIVRERRKPNEKGLVSVYCCCQFNKT